MESRTYRIAVPLHITAIATAALFVSACSSGSGEGQPSATDAGGGDAQIAADGSAAASFAVLVVGTLADSDLTTAQSKHDSVAEDGHGPATMAGDVGHAVLLGTNILGTTPNQFLALDRWNDGANIDGFYSNPQLAAGFAMVFAKPPEITKYAAQPGWAGYGTLDSADSADPHYWVVVRGTMKSSDAATNQAAHDAIAAQAGPKAQAAGDAAHVAYTGRDDARVFLAIDVWPQSANIAAFYSNPDVQKAFGGLFAGPPSVSVYESTHWYQW
jgi:quinol monooxygenase YgiN